MVGGTPDTDHAQVPHIINHYVLYNLTQHPTKQVSWQFFVWGHPSFSLSETQKGWAIKTS